MAKYIDDCQRGCIEHRQFLTKESSKIVSDYKRDFKFEQDINITKSQVINRILIEFNKLKGI